MRLGEVTNRDREAKKTKAWDFPTPRHRGQKKEPAKETEMEQPV